MLTPHPANRNVPSVRHNALGYSDLVASPSEPFQFIATPHRGAQAQGQLLTAVQLCTTQHRATAERQVLIEGRTSSMGGDCIPSLVSLLFIYIRI
jgi:hypothetical protein